MSIIRAVCEQDEYCYVELWSFTESLKELDRKLDDIKIEGSLGVSAPIAVSVPEETLSEMSDKLFEALRDLGYDVDKESVEKGARGYYSPEDQASSFASFAFKRLLYKVSKSSQHQLLSKPWTETRCPVCGLVPIASIEEFEDEKAPKVRYKCMCGNSWEFDHFVCPNCKNDRAEDFEIQHVGRVPVYICKKCGHLVLMANSKDIVSPGDEEVLPIVAAIAINAMMSSEEEEDFIESPEGDEHDET